MNVKITPSALKGEINAIPSKSYAHRILIAAHLASGETKINNLIDSHDIIATRQCLKDFNLEEPLLNCIESGSTLRFLLPVAGALGLRATFFGKGKLPFRPNTALVECLKKHGLGIEEHKNVDDGAENIKPIYTLKGKLKSGKYEIDGGVSSQFISGLLLALPLLKDDSEIALTSPLVSKNYVDITLDVLKKFGILIEKTNFGYFVKGNQAYKKLKEISVEGDWSNSAFWLVASEINGKIEIKGLNKNSYQGDRKIQNIIEMCKANEDEILIDAEDIPDLVPIISVLLARKVKKGTIKNIERLKIKESDRILSTTKLLSSFGVKFELGDNALTIYKSDFLGGSIIEGFNDHRIPMTATIAASVASSSSEITTANAVNKSYPHFFKDFESLGGIYEKLWV